MVLSKEKLFIADPYNDTHIKAIINFEKENNIEKKISEELERIKSSTPRKQYIENVENSNDLSLYIYLEEENKIKDGCFIQGEKEIKKCKIVFAPIHTLSRKKMIRLVEKYAFKILGMEEVFLEVDQRDKTTITYLESRYENLGEDNEKILFLKEKKK